MFSKNNPRYFEHNPHMLLTLDTGGIIRRRLYFNPRGYHITKFEFVNCSNFRITENFMSWFIYQFLPQVQSDDFMFQLSMSTAPADLQHRLTQFQGTPNVIYLQQATTSNL